MISTLPQPIAVSFCSKIGIPHIQVILDRAFLVCCLLSVVQDDAAFWCNKSTKPVAEHKPISNYQTSLALINNQPLINHQLTLAQPLNTSQQSTSQPFIPPSFTSNQPFIHHSSTIDLRFIAITRRGNSFSPAPRFDPAPHQRVAAERSPALSCEHS